ncbi:MAG TPA: ECF transporter S component [Candidatus Avamphibacillus intestinigallinarum]|nr:ECF transporter S component [Candidatus Avamphibacillus intestinigallinarum]
MGVKSFSTYRLTLLALLATIAIIGRNVLTFLPNIQPVTTIVIITTCLLGLIDAFLLIMVIVIVSNMYLGFGIWAFWQIIAWSAIALCTKGFKIVFKKDSIITLGIFSFLSGYMYGFIISLFTYQITGKFWPYYIAGIPFDTYHAIGNVIFMFILLPLLKQAIKLYPYSTPNK